jgi:hypothetical protein
MFLLFLQKKTDLFIIGKTPRVEVTISNIKYERVKKGLGTQN